TCANYAIGRGLPVILEYEDDRFVDVGGAATNGFGVRRDMRKARRLLPLLSGCIGVSPHLLAQLPSRIPTLLLRGVIGADLIEARNELGAPKRNVVLFSGTHIASNGVGELIQGWRDAQLSGWELHITG